MKNKSPQSTPSTPQSPSPNIPASGKNPNSDSSRLDREVRNVGDELEDDAKKKLGEEIADKTKPGSSS